MRIHHNIAALNTHRNLGFNNTNANKALEKLSSGYKINRAGDDAAGLAISEKMRGQIRGLDMATKNAQDGISLIQTAEGALHEVHSLLQRGRELSVQAANDTNVDFDREALQLEIDEIKKEINRIGTDTEFNTIKLLTTDSIIPIPDPPPPIAGGGGGGTGGGSGVSGAGGVTGVDPTAARTERIEQFTSALMGSMMANAEQAVWDAFGLDVSNTYDMDITYTTSPQGNAVASVSYMYTPSTGKGSPTTMDFNLTYFVDGVNPGISADRVVAHEMVHAAMAGANMAMADYPFWFVEGTAEYVAGGNERVRSHLNWQTPTATNVKALVDKLGNRDSSGYASGFLATKYLDDLIQKAGHSTGIKAMMQWLDDTPTRKLTDGIQQFTGLTQAQFEAKFKSLDGGVQFVLDTGVSGTGSILTNYGYDDSDTGIIPDTSNPISSGSKFNFNYDWSNVPQAATTPFVELAASIPVTTSQSTAIDLRSGHQLTFHIGANENQNVKFDIVNISDERLEIDMVTIETQENADQAIKKFDTAIDSVSLIRANFGALQNRLEHTMNSLANTSENLTDAESRIRDTDIAKEMMNFTKQNILMQAAQSMLSQANQQPQGVLQLLN